MSAAIDTTSVEVWNKACAVALNELPQMGLQRLGALSSLGTPVQCWKLLSQGEVAPEQIFTRRRGDEPSLLKQWQRLTQSQDPFAIYQRYVDAGCSVLTPSCSDYPTQLLGDPKRPQVLIARGNVALLNAPAVAIIGTRHCTPTGRTIAERFGEDLTVKGISVVSGLALGIDAAAHRGALNSPRGPGPIAVVGSGLNSIYPRRNAALWSRVEQGGVVVSEAPLNAQAEAWRFPQRNRIIAGLSRAVIVVESHIRGGSLLTVNDANERGVEVFAVPGSILSPASEGTNALLNDGIAPANCIDDVLVRLSLDTSSATPRAIGKQIALCLDPDLEKVLGFIPTEGISPDSLMFNSSTGPGQLASALVELRQYGLIEEVNGRWFKVA